MSETGTFRVAAISLANGTRRIIAEHKSDRDAEAIIKMAVIRRGDKEYFIKEPEHA